MKNVIFKVSSLFDFLFDFLISFIGSERDKSSSLATLLKAKVFL